LPGHVGVRRRVISPKGAWLKASTLVAVKRVPRSPDGLRGGELSPLFVHKPVDKSHAATDSPAVQAFADSAKGKFHPPAGGPTALHLGYASCKAGKKTLP